MWCIFSLSFTLLYSRMAQKGGQHQTEIASIETIENGTCANNIRYLLRFVGFLVSFSKLFATLAGSLYLYLVHSFSVSLFIWNAGQKNATTHLSIVVIHFVNSINTLMGTKLMPRHSLERIASDCNVVFTINVAYEPHQNSVFAFFMFNLRMLRRLPSISLSQSLGSWKL